MALISSSSQRVNGAESRQKERGRFNLCKSMRISGEPFGNSRSHSLIHVACACLKISWSLMLGILVLWPTIADHVLCPSDDG